LAAFLAKFHSIGRRMVVRPVFQGGVLRRADAPDPIFHAVSLAVGCARKIAEAVSLAPASFALRGDAFGRETVYDVAADRPDDAHTHLHRAIVLRRSGAPARSGVKTQAGESRGQTVDRKEGGRGGSRVVEGAPLRGGG